jgi:hypothetical protein
MCQNVPSLGELVSPQAGPPARTPPRPSGAPNAFTDHEPETGSPGVCNSMPGFDSLEPPGKSNTPATGWT